MDGPKRPGDVVITVYKPCTQGSKRHQFLLLERMTPSGNDAVEEGYEVCKVWAGQDMGS